MRNATPSRFILLLVAMGVLTCGGKKPTPDNELTTPVEPAIEVFEHPDPGPQFERATGKLKAMERGEMSVEAIHVHRTKTHSWVVFPDPANTGVSSEASSYDVTAAGHGVAVPWRSGEQREPAIVVRWVGSLPSRFEVDWSLRPAVYRFSVPIEGQRGRYVVTVDPATPIRTELADEFRRSAAQHFEDAGWKTGNALGFHLFATSRLNQQAGAAAPADGRLGADQYELMRLYSGLASVDEALQQDRGLRLNAADPADAMVDLVTVEGVPLPPHPWPRLISALGATPKPDELARHVPADMAFVHFGDLRDLLRVVDDLEDWASSVVQVFEETPGPSHFLEGYERQLMLARSGVAKRLGHVAASEVAMVTSDPFLRSGTDVSMLFRVANRTALVAALTAFETEARSGRTDVAETSWKLGDVTVRTVSTPDRSILQHRAEWGDLLVISNSKGAIERLHAASTGKTRSLRDSGDYQYMRARFPFDPKAEGVGFFFLGDAFVARAVGPEVKIQEARRMQERADLFAVNNAALLHGWFEGVRPANTEEIIAAGWLEKGDLVHADGTAIVFDPERGAMSPYGRVGNMVPIVDRKLTTVTPAERDAYGQFRQGYQQYWSAFIDPIAGRLTRGDDGRELVMEMVVLPLIDASEYRELLEMVGDKRLAIPTTDTGLQWTFAIGDDARLRKDLTRAASGFLGTQKQIFDWLGDWATVGLADRSGVWDVAMMTGAIPTTSVESGGGSLDELAALVHLPVYAGVDVKNKASLAVVLSMVRKWILDGAPDLVTWEPTDPYRDVSIVRVGEGGEGRGVVRGLALHYATAGNVFLVAFDRTALEIQIDRALANGFDAPRADVGADQLALQLALAEPSSWLGRTVLGTIEYAVLSNQGFVEAGWEVLHRGLPGARLDAEGTRRLGLAYLGVEPRNPHGGSFRYERAAVTHSLYGSAVARALPELPVPDSPISRFVASLARLDFRLSFDGEGESQGLRSQVTLKSR